MDISSNRNNGVSSEINVTPLIDVLLVLLIIFMVIQPAAVRGLNALVPQPTDAHNKVMANAEPIVVQITANQRGGAAYRINEVAFDRAAIEPKLKEIFANRQEKVMFVKGDAGLDFSSVAEIIDDGHRAGVQEIGILTPQSGTSQ